MQVLESYDFIVFLYEGQGGSGTPYGVLHAHWGVLAASVISHKELKRSNETTLLLLVPTTK